MSNQSFWEVKVPWRAAVLAAFLLWNPPSARAHRVSIDSAVSSDGRVRVEVYFARGGPAAEALVRMLSPDGTPVAEAKADADGVCQFEVNEARAYKFEAVIAGHRATCKLSPDEVEALRSSLSPRAGPDEASSAPASPDQENTGSVGTSLRSLRESDPTQSTLATAVLGGMGFIFGLAAFVMVLAQRKTIQSLRRELARPAGPKDNDP